MPASSFPLGGQERPLRVAVVGSGPSGFYAAESLLRQPQMTVFVDMFDRLPTPFGLVRGGVAPDHQKIKSVIAVYEKTAAHPNFCFFGNVKLGRELSVEDLRKHYDQIVYAVGNESDKRLGIPGEDLTGSHAATAFVGWYNGHPDYRNQTFDLSVESVAVVGMGNVAMDVTRILAQKPGPLASTDIADNALESLKKSRVRTIYVLGRRGAAQAAFSPAEIKEIAELEGSDLVALPEEVRVNEISQEDLRDPKNKKNVDFLAGQAAKGEGTNPRKVRLRLLVSPVEILGEGGKVSAVKIERNVLVKDEKGRVRAQGTGRYETLKVGLVLRSVGYNGIPIPGVPFDEKSGHIPNKDGRVLDPNSQIPVPMEYVVGWAKRGPSGLIGTNRADSAATVQAMTADLAGRTATALAADERNYIPSILKSKDVLWVSFQDWKNLDQLEILRGKPKGKIRDKFSSVEEMLSALKETPSGAAA